jgi:ankyrin repeat protein
MPSRNNPQAAPIQGFPALTSAVLRQELEEAKDLLQSGADIDEKGNFGNTALMVAAECNLMPMVELLLGKGADINATNQYGMTALMWAVGNNNVQIVALLVKEGAALDAKDGQGKTAQVWAQEYGYTAIEQMLQDAAKAKSDARREAEEKRRAEDEAAAKERARHAVVSARQEQLKNKSRNPPKPGGIS